MATSPTIALATCRDLPDWEIDDEPLRAALRGAGCRLVEPAWDDPDFDWSCVAVCLLRTTWDYQDRVPEFVAWAERVARQCVLLNPVSVLRWNADKQYLRDLRDAGLPIAPTCWLERGDEAEIAGFLAAQGSERGFLKPCYGACARETLRFTADAAGLAAAAAHAQRLLAAERIMLQPYLAAVETEGEYSLMLFDGEPSHAVCKRPVAGDYRVMDDFGAEDARVEMDPAAWQLGQDVLQHLSARFGLERPLCYARIDLLRGMDGAFVLNEVELIEPSLFFRHRPAGAAQLAAAVLRRVPGLG